MSTSEDFEKLATRRNYFYRNQFRRTVRLLLLMILVCIGLLVSLFFAYVTTPKQKYYASTTTGSVIPIFSLSSPVVTQPFIEQWSEVVARTAYSLNFLTYQKQLKKASVYFTKDGWTSFMSAIQGSGYLDKLKQAKLDISTVVNGPVVIVNRFISDGHYTWQVQMPLLVLYTSANMNVKDQLYVNMTIKRVPELLIPQGIAVTNFTVSGVSNG